MPAIPNSYIIPFDPLGNPLGTLLTAAQRYNRGFKRIKRGSVMSPYPDPACVYRRSVISDLGDDMFKDVYLGDMWVCRLLAFDAILTIYHRVQANKMISCHRLLVDPSVKGNLRGLLALGARGWCPDPVHHKYIARKWTKDLANTHPEYSKDIQNFPSQFN
jgi:hypothetical protein